MSLENFMQTLPQSLILLTSLLGITSTILTPPVATTTAYVFAKDNGFKNGKDAVKAFWKAAYEVDLRDYFKLSNEEFDLKYANLNLGQHMSY